MEFLRKHAALIALGALIAIISFNLGMNRGQTTVSVTPSSSLVNLDEGEPSDIDFALFWKAWNIINEKYVPASTTAERVGDQEKVYGAIEGLAASLNDPYTIFFPPVESEIFASEVRGNFEGIGAEILAQDGAITIVAPLKGSPAERAGLHPGDRITKINDKDTGNMATEDAVKLIRGPKGTKVSLTIDRSGSAQPLVIAVERDVINVPVVHTQQLPDGVFKIDLYSFSENSPNLFRGALREFVQSKSDKLILDLRGNPGGYLEAAIDMASWFLPSNKVVVREDFGGKREEKIYRSRGYDVFNDNLKLVILVDKGSASAAEILAGALQEQGKATIVGETTFGKGSVQELIDLADGTSLKVTVARWMTPKGTSISEKGIEPDFKIEYTADDRKAGIDPQFDKAVEILTKG